MAEEIGRLLELLLFLGENRLLEVVILPEGLAKAKGKEEDWGPADPELKALFLVHDEEGLLEAEEVAVFKFLERKVLYKSGLQA